MIAFFVGTAAELVKVAPVIREVKRRGGDFIVVSSGQNDLRGSELWKLAAVDGPDVILSTKPIPPRATGLASFLVRTSASGIGELRRALDAHRGGRSGGRSRKTTKAVVHGDTVSTLMGATMFAALGVPVHHIEAGLRSFDLREPFPEEICRVLVSRLASVAYCPNEWAASHLRRTSLRKVLTEGNTLYDALGIALGGDAADTALPEGLGLEAPYFVLVVHRQENLLGMSFLRSVVERVRAAPHRPRCVFVMHALTRAGLERARLMSEIEHDPSFVLLPRQPYVRFANLLARAEFLVTDGGSNQEEAYYLGKPCLLMRRVTERVEGLGENVLLAPRPLEEIDAFMRNPARWARPRVTLAASPSAIIASDLLSEQAPRTS
jgi:UDP-N-acetylglucosamine 2-epimerase (non-hydrolysing)